MAIYIVIESINWLEETFTLALLLSLWVIRESLREKFIKMILLKMNLRTDKFYCILLILYFDMKVSL